MKSPARRREDLLATAICAELCSDLIDGGVEQLHFYTLNRPELTRDVCHALGVTPRIDLQNVRNTCPCSSGFLACGKIGVRAMFFAKDASGLLAQDELLSMSGLEFMQGMLAGRLPAPPISQTMGYALHLVEEAGRFFVAAPALR